MYELMEKMYIDMQDGFKQVNDDFKQVNSRIDTLETKVNFIEKTVVKIENDHGEKLSALFDDRVVQKEVNERTNDTLNRIEAKVEVLQMETAHIRRVK